MCKFSGPLFHDENPTDDVSSLYSVSGFDEQPTRIEIKPDHRLASKHYNIM
jgi:hypothetical protein